MANKPKRPAKSHKKNTHPKKGAPVALYHDMLVSENFERCAVRLFSILQTAQEQHPNKKRILYLDVQGHRNSAGGFDQDALEITQDFVMGSLMPYLSEAVTPFFHLKNPKPQRNDIPPELIVVPADDQKPLVRDAVPEKRKTKPSAQAITAYLGTGEGECYICWRGPVERAHAVPLSLGGSNDMRNIVLLCKERHQAAPDVNDPEAFWDWIDWRIDKEGRYNRHGVKPKDDHFANVRDELIELYKWTEAEVDSLINATLLQEYYRVLEAETTTHFGIKRKPSTEAWAFHKARLHLQI